MGISLELKNACDNIIEYYDKNDSNLLQILLKIQKQIPGKYISYNTAKYVANELNIAVSRVYEVATFFDAINTEPKGKYIIHVCNSTACHLNGYNELVKIFEDFLQIKIGDTTSDRMFTLKYSPCFGACDISPAVRINDDIYGNLDKEKISSIINRLRGE